MRLFPVCKDSDQSFSSVLLPIGSSKHNVEAALVAVGIYAPRGDDSLEWGVYPGAAATIFDGNGEPIVHLLYEDE